MSIRYDHKGKYFTEVKSKDSVLVRIQTTDAQINGVIHVQPDIRLLDEVNNGEEFIPITDAEIHQDGEILRTPFLALNRSHIEYILPMENQDES